MVQATSARHLSISVAYPHKAPDIALFMDYPRIIDVDVLADITIAWARANLREGGRVSNYIGMLANMAGGDTYLFRKWMLDLLAEAEVDTDICYVDISQELEDNSWYRWLNSLSQGSFGSDDGYPVHFEPCNAVLREEGGEMSLKGHGKGSGK